MTQRDYEIIADFVRDLIATNNCAGTPIERDRPILGLYPVLDRLCLKLLADNPNFHRHSFLQRALGEVPPPTLEYTIAKDHPEVTE